MQLDLLLRIDFLEFVTLSDNYDEQVSLLKKTLKKKYKFNKYFRRRDDDYEYIRLSDIEDQIESYHQYLLDLENHSIFQCCQLEQAIGLFENDELLIFFSADSGLCYNTSAHLNAIEECYQYNSKEEFFQEQSYVPTTFIGYRKADKLSFLYSTTSYNIDSESSENRDLQFDFLEFKDKLDTLKIKISNFYSQIKTMIRDEIKTMIRDEIKNEDSENIEDVFCENAL